MFWKLTLKEIKYQLKSITFYVFIGVILLFYSTQFGGDAEEILPPEPGQDYYGYVVETDKYKEMDSICKDLMRDYRNGEIRKYEPFYKKVQLSDEEKSQMKKYIDEMIPGWDNKEIPIKDPHKDIKVTYNEYLDILHKIDKLIGGNTVYNDELRHVHRKKTYEEALKDYEEIVKEDKLTNASARLFADYMGITAGIYAVFIPAFVLLRDKKNKAYELVYSSQVSSFKYVLSKYTAVCLCIMSCYLVLSLYTTFGYIKLANANNYIIDKFAFFKYTLTWIAPTVFTTVSVGMLLSVVFNNVIVPIVFQVIYAWSQMMPLSGDYSLTKIVIRFNKFGHYSDYMNWRQAIMINRIFYTVLALVLILITAYVWDRKRKNINGRNCRKLFLRK